jgi:hypothetical protein
MPKKLGTCNFSALHKRAEKGVAYLAKVSPDWCNQIDLNILDMHSATKDVCGQIFGYYGRAPNGGILSDSKLEKLGFSAETNEELDELTCWWRDFIVKGKLICS